MCAVDGYTEIQKLFGCEDSTHLRHTFASLALLRGAKPKVISEALGHSSVAFTMDTYSHIIEGMQSDARRYWTRYYRQG